MRADKIKIEFRDTIALAVLPVLLLKCKHLEYSQITDLCYQIADTMLSSKNKQINLFNNMENK